MATTEDSSSDLPEQGRPIATMSGHWVLARLGKRVLRPGGRELTREMLDVGDLAGRDVVELAPGLGHTAVEIAARDPASYRGIDSDPAAAREVGRRLGRADAVLVADASETGLADDSADVVFGEAMLTMHTDRAKQQVMQEAYRVLRPGGRYIIHELGLTPDDLPEADKHELQRALATSIKVNARPLTDAEWRALLEQVGFVVRTKTVFAPMRLLEPARIIADEGLLGALRFAGNLLRRKDERRRVLEMRKTFTAHRRALVAVGLVATKPE